MFPKQPVSAGREAAESRGTKPQGWRLQSFSTLLCGDARRQRCSTPTRFSRFSNLTYLTSCFLGSKMLSSLSAYTFLEAVKRMICKNNKKKTKNRIFISSNTLLVIYRSGFWVYLIDLRHAFQKLSEERPQAHIHLQTTRKRNTQTATVSFSVVHH